MSITILAFNIDYLQEKQMTKFFKNSKKNNIFSGHFVPFLPKLEKSEFFWKKRLCQFLNTLINYHDAKNQIKL